MDLNNLVDKAKDLASNVPDDMKQKAEEVINEQVDKYAPDNMKEQAQGLVDGLKGQLGL
ncbi:hypothetical protein [Lactococcus formosensis]|jgi:hypothetical protein|uniref:hypothetical protein n=1 Tax=Lactococcus formosensis TaxID=1281486 RepID=UPI0024349252|nr:hypothetical protein [Lactococcus formosensis]MDG6119407.1 hypothetical protein [Lactococcus formosensis]